MKKTFLAVIVGLSMVFVAFAATTVTLTVTPSQDAKTMSSQLQRVGRANFGVALQNYFAKLVAGSNHAQVIISIAGSDGTGAAFTTTTSTYNFGK